MNRDHLLCQATVTKSRSRPSGSPCRGKAKDGTAFCRRHQRSHAGAKPGLRHTCSYVFRSGTRKGQACHILVAGIGCRCYNHSTSSHIAAEERAAARIVLALCPTGLGDLAQIIAGYVGN
jgi:hypothetical protein